MCGKRFPIFLSSVFYSYDMYTRHSLNELYNKLEAYWRDGLLLGIFRVFSRQQICVIILLQVRSQLLKQSAVVTQRDERQTKLTKQMF